MSDPKADLDVVIVGGGVAACVAALEILHQRPQARVAMVAAGEGASGLAGGVWDAIGGARKGGLARSLERFAEKRVGHPWSRLGPLALDALVAGRARLATALGWDPQLPERDALVATEMGSLRSALFAEPEVLDLADGTLRCVLVAALPALRDPDAHFLARTLGEGAALMDLPTRFVGADVEFIRRKRDVLLQPSEAARVLDAAAARKRMASVLRRAMGGADVDAILLPPVLGFDNRGVRSILEGELGIRVGELASSSGGQGGRRSARLWGVVQSAGVALSRKRTVKAERSGAVHRLTLDDGTSLDTPVLVLAGGKHLGGGITLEGAPRERVLGLPLSEDGRSPSSDLARLMKARARVGVAWSAETMSPLDSEAEPVPGVFACGSLLGGASLDDGSGLGVALATGVLAGRAAAHHDAGGAAHSIK